jgi:glycosyltransferase involved in cell wall biosynthesis
MKTVVLIDPLSAGHHPTYLRLFSKALLELGHRVVVCSPEPERLSDWVSKTCGGQVHRFGSLAIGEPQRLRFPNSSVRGCWTTAARWFLAGRAAQKVSRAYGKRPDLVFFPWLDCYLNFAPAFIQPWLRLVFRDRWSGLYFHPKHLRAAPGLIGKTKPADVDKLLRAANCRSVAVLDEGIVESLAARIGFKPVIHFPDVADDSKPDPAYLPLREIARRSQGRPIIGLIGSLEQRKGLLTLLEVAQQSAHNDWFFLFAGELVGSSFAAPELERIRAAQEQMPNCYFLLERAPSEAGFNALIDVCRVLYAAYWGFPHSSNLLTKAAIFRKPVIVSEGFCMAERVRRYRLGRCIEAGHVAQCVEAIQGLLSGPTPAKYEPYLRDHSPEKLHQAFERVLAA